MAPGGGAEDLPRPGPTGAPGAIGGGTEDGLAGDLPSDADVARLRRELVQAPAAVVVANHAYGLFELAAIHLSEQPPNLDQAQVAVDAFGAVVEVLGDRLGDAARPLHDALAQIRLAFVQLSASTSIPPGDAPGDGAAP